MADNVLIPGAPRLGWLHIDGSTEEGQVAAMLQDTGSTIKLTLPLDSGIRSSLPHSRWWSDEIMHLDDLDQTKHSYAPPRGLVFQDSFGLVALVGCRATNYRSSSSAGHGEVVPNFAVLGGRSFDYERINGMRTEVPALAEWTRLSAMTFKRETDENHRIQALELRLSSPKPIRLTPKMNLQMRMHWRTNNQRGNFIADETVQLQTLTKGVKSWDEHLNLHGAMLELVTIAGGKPFGWSNLEVRLDAERHRIGPDKFTDPEWRKVAHHRFPGQDEPVDKAKFLFPWSEIGARGVKRWLKLREEYDRAVKAVLGILRSDEMWSVQNVVQSGVALEALGYAIDVNKHGGANLNSRRQMNFNTGLRLIIDDMKASPIGDPENWIKRVNTAYMGAKHPDRGDLPDTLDLVNSLRENLHVLRFWIAQELGVKPATLMDRFQLEPHRASFVRAE